MLNMSIHNFTGMNKYKVDIDDVFNETDSDTDQHVIGFHDHKDPPTVLVRPIKTEDECDEDTEEEYDIKYVKKWEVSPIH